MAKIKFGQGGLMLEASLPEPEESEVREPETHEIINEEHPDVLATLLARDLEDKVDEIRLNQLSFESQVEKDLSDLESKMTRIEKPVVKNITIDSDNSDDLDALEGSIKKTVDSLISERKTEHEQLVRFILSGNRLQSAINFLLAIGLVLVIYLK